MSPISRPALWALTAAALIATAPWAAARAQPDDPGRLPVLEIAPNVLGHAEDAALREGLQRSFAAAPVQAAPRRETRASLAYEFTPALRGQALQAFAARAPDAEAAQAVRDVFAKHDYDQAYRGLIAPYGLAADDVADAMTAYLVLGWRIVNGASEPHPGSVRAARNQIAETLAGDPRYADDKARGEAGEEFKLLVVTTHAGWASARKDGSLPAYEAGVARNLAGAGFDMKMLDLTRAGFQARR